MLFVSMDFPPERRSLQLALRYLTVCVVSTALFKGRTFLFFFFPIHVIFFSCIFFFLEDNISWIHLKGCVLL